jgi:hypothetical protein
MLGLKTVRGCFGSIVMVGLLGVAAFAGWKWGDPFFRRVAPGSGPTEPSVATRELSDSTIVRFEAFRRGEGDERLVLGSLELESVLRFGVPQMLPPGVGAPSVKMKDGVIEVAGDVAVASFPDLPDLGGVLGFLPDTLRVEVEGTVSSLSERRSALVVHQVRALGIPLPDRMITGILVAFGRQEIADLPADAMPVPLPDGIESAYILRDSLVLVHSR